MRRLIGILVPLCVLGMAVAINVSNPGWLQEVRLRGFDQLQIQYPRVYDPDNPVRIVDIDDATLERLGQWPFPRNLMAQMINRLNEAGVAAIGLDIVFPEPDRTSPKTFLQQWKQEVPQWQSMMGFAQDYDQQFAQAIEQANVVAGFVLTNDEGEVPELKASYALMGEEPSGAMHTYKGAVVNLPVITEAAAGNGALNSITDPDGMIRRMPLVFRMGEEFYPSLSAELLRIAQGASTYAIKAVGASQEIGEGEGIVKVKVGQFVIPTNPAGDFWIRYTSYEPARYVPAWKLFDPAYDASELAGRIVLIGTSAAGLKDIRATPMNQVTSGVEVHAQALEQVVAGDFLSRPDWIVGAELLAMIGIGLLLIVMMNFLPALWGALFTVAVMGGAIWGATYAYRSHQLLLDAVTPGVAIILIYLVESLRRFYMAEREKHEIRQAFSHYMSPAMVERLAANPDALKLGGEMREMTILFCDIRGFTAISELYNAEELTRFINRFLTPMTDIILSKRGTIDKYMGDAIMAFWNAPLDDAEHARQGCLAALAMLDGLTALNAEREAEAAREQSPFLPVQIGIGLNSGLCCVGNMGSQQRFDYSVLGDDVNLASRLEGQSKSYGVAIVIGDKTAKEVPDLATIELDLLRVKGKQEAVRIHALLGDAALASREEFKRLRETVAAMHTAYRAQDWAGTQARIADASDQAAELGLHLEDFFGLYRERCASYAAEPPAADWDGVYEAKTK